MLRKYGGLRNRPQRGPAACSRILPGSSVYPAWVRGPDASDVMSECGGNASSWPGSDGARFSGASIAAEPTSREMCQVGQKFPIFSEILKALLQSGQGHSGGFAFQEIRCVTSLLDHGEIDHHVHPTWMARECEFDNFRIFLLLVAMETQYQLLFSIFLRVFHLRIFPHLIYILYLYTGHVLLISGHHPEGISLSESFLFQVCPAHFLLHAVKEAHCFQRQRDVAQVFGKGGPGQSWQMKMRP